MKLGVAGAFAAVVACLAGCPKGAEAPRAADYRAAVVFAAKGVVRIDKACSDVVHVLEGSSKDAALSLADECTRLSRDALAALTVADEALDTYDASKAGAIACAVGHGAYAITAIGELVTAHGGEVPQEVDDALAFIGPIGGASCAAPAAASASGSSS